MRICVLLSTYNGEMYLQEQLDSLINQTHVDFLVYIRDDGSSDETVNIIEKCCSSDTRFRFLASEGNVGCAQSFLTLLASTDADVYMFCDQDDVWYKDKIKRVNDFFKKNDDAQKPILYHTDLEVVDSDLKTLHNSFLEYQCMSAKHAMDKKNIFIQNFVVGCTTAINRALALKVLSANMQGENVAMHDWWCALIARSFGLIYFDDIKTLKYRQHSNNVLGAQPNTIARFYNSFASGVGIERVRKFRDVVSKQNESFYKCYKNELSDDINISLQLIARGLGQNANVFDLMKCFFCGLYMQGLKRNLALVYSVIKTKKIKNTI